MKDLGMLMIFTQLWNGSYLYYKEIHIRKLKKSSSYKKSRYWYFQISKKALFKEALECRSIFRCEDSVMKVLQKFCIFNSRFAFLIVNWISEEPFLPFLLFQYIGNGIGLFIPPSIYLSIYIRVLPFFAFAMVISRPPLTQIFSLSF